MKTTERREQRARATARRRVGLFACRRPGVPCRCGRRSAAPMAASALALMLTVVGGCAARGPEPAVMQSLSEVEIRIRLLQTELTDVRRALAESEIQRGRHVDAENALQLRLDEIQASIGALPENLTGLCPAPPESPPVAAQQREPEIQRVVVSGDKLVVGEMERVWVDPPAAFLMARIDAAAEYSFLRAEEVVEFERDGNRWVRFGVTVEEERVSIERPLKRFVRARNERRAIVDLRVQVGDVRETVEFALGDLPAQEQPVILGRNFLTDVALLDVSRRNIQPAFEAPNGSGL